MIRPRCAVAIALFLLAGCISLPVATETDTPIEPEVMAACAVAENDFEEPPIGPEYWASGTFHERDDLDTLFRSWFGSQLCAMGEGPITAQTPNHTMRFLWLRSFHPGVVVRIGRSKGRWMLDAKVLDGAGGYAPGKLNRSVRHEVSDSQAAAIANEIDQADFWNLPTFKPNTSMDGANWVVEVATGEAYHVVNRHSGDEIYGLGLLMLEISGLDPNPIY